MSSEPHLSPVLRVTDSAREMVLRARSDEPDGESLALWLDVSGVSAGAFQYEMYFEALADAGPSDAVVHHDDLAVVVPRASVERLRGATLDAGGDDGGLFIVNPNSPPPEPGARPQADLSDPLSQRVLEVLEDEINPSIAAHGGRADLVAVEEGTAYLRLSGGCQGCGLAKVTLSQGIEVAIQDAVPEITSVVDVTDHASGSNPYFEPAKK